MKLNQTSYATVQRSRFVVPTLGAAGDQSAFFRVEGPAPISGAAAGMGYRPWSPPIT